MVPTYLNEHRYSYFASAKSAKLVFEYEVDTPESTFERQVQSLYLEGQQRLQQEEFGLALNAFREFQALILKTADPELPVDPNRKPDFAFPLDVSLIDTLAIKTAEILVNTPPPTSTLPKTVVSEESILPTAVRRAISPLVASGLKVTSFQADVRTRVDRALDAVGENDWDEAAKLYKSALKAAPEEDAAIRGGLLYDLAIITEKADNRRAALKFGQQSVGLFAKAALREAQARALEVVGGMFGRAGDQARTEKMLQQAAELRAEHNLDTVVIRPALRTIATATELAREVAANGSHTLPAISGRAVDSRALALGETAAAPTDLNTMVLMGTELLDAATIEKSYTVLGDNEVAAIKLSDDGPKGITDFLGTISATTDIGLVTDFWWNPVQIVAYLPHMYFFVVPMAIGDCLAGMGNLEEAAEQYESVLVYPYINTNYEIVRLWTRLADTYIEIGDAAYRNAKDNVSAFAAAKAAYAQIVKGDNTLKATSPLYGDAKFAGIKARVEALLATADPLGANENPQITSAILGTRSRLQQIAAGLNFFGFAPDYAPPFGFEYLQTTARYFAQQASQIEQRYAQYKSTAENEELRREQLDQQADVARQSVVLEQRGVAEAQAGAAVAQAGLNYAELQRVNALQSRNDFNNVRWELLELAEAEAWANAASVDEDDEVLLTWYGNYYNSRDKPRSDVIQNLAYRRTRISHDLEAARLQRAIDSAVAYKGVAQAQVTQANARVAVAQQRVVVAQLQQRFAEENRDFLDMKEFGARLWYELARFARRLSRRYLDMATEVGFLMERAYNAETERGLGVIRYDYSQTSANDLMGADLLLADIDYFTLDHVTTTVTKKAPVKKVISLADRHPMAFQQLKSAGRALFPTELADFDRDHAGLYLCKLRNVELVFVGVTGAAGIAGTLRNIGVSRFRQSAGSIVTRVYPSDVLPLSQYDIRQDALAFRVNPNDLRLFENNGIETLWQLDLPMDANDFAYNEILDIQLVLYYDGFFSPALEASVRAALPPSGAASRAFSMRMTAPDELFYLRSRGEAELLFDSGLFPRNQIHLERTAVTLKAAGSASVIDGLTMRLTSDVHGAELTLTTDASGEVNDQTPGKPLDALLGEDLLDTWSISITAADNPGRVVNGSLDLGGLEDLLVFFEYSFDYR